MNDDLIKRSDAAEVVYKALRTPPLKGVLTDTMSLAIALVRDIPSADRPRGEWIDKGWHGDWQFETDGRGNCWKAFECSNCNCHAKYITPFCPQCGAKMEGVDDEKSY